uniref:Cation-transporting P-type ATPase N-terminal domain-containing protein n=1 Tax=Chromera velia CCMP2878 TaxID=1169474 RepID=A0A0G4GNG0_9ALVE|eukprot:Cvel_22670.t1-p1 / transcript=Cvel_22670.t1 / gene=Cvel_22670 / organism=Chromera_velia_CCMP2878 / gene_product=Probable cation-transporting ATPase 13A1, putative / transcript_product=Probable cation-transporting ATPase 13A1, putative / location=Cvel_scaffold2253:15105-31758(-) / protein_length=1270 / sequence_SO=supercontig / SO=protein_coding / is_pseudo=false
MQSSKKFEFYQELPVQWRLDVWPFAAAYVIALVRTLPLAFSEEYAHWPVVVFGLLIFAHGLTHLCTHWNVHVQAALAFKRVSSLQKASHVKVIPSKPLSGTLLCPIQKVQQGRDGASDDEPEEVFVIYQCKKLVYDKKMGIFRGLQYPLTLPMKVYASSGGLSDKEAEIARGRFGPNDFAIPVPECLDLFKEHAVAPFFVFQMLCVVLWLMDEYWYYSIMTAVLLIFMEIQLVHRRIHDAKDMADMRVTGRSVTVFRGGQWRSIHSHSLLPGDLLAISRLPHEKEENLVCPCDLLLLQGTCTMNEASLTGESVPQLKSGIVGIVGGVALSSDDVDESEASLDVKGKHKQHVLYAGTTLLLHRNEDDKDQELPWLRGKKIPNKGCVGFVLRTGFKTTQGKLVRTIHFASKRVTVDSSEVYIFLACLCVAALGAATFVLMEGLAAGRSKFKLFLACSHIVTSVVPPEFPITLSMAVTLALIKLLKGRIYCSEPFRLPFAGKITVCAFDKTGTLTSDRMDVAGVEGLPEFPAPSSSSSVSVEDGTGGGKEKEKNAKRSEAAVDMKTSGSAINQSLPFLSLAVVGACHSLSTTSVGGEVVGDPLETAALRSGGWTLINGDCASAEVGGKRGAEKLQVLVRFPFSSELARMTVVARHEGQGGGWNPSKSERLEEALRGKETKKPAGAAGLVLCKGSPEKLEPFLSVVPEGFRETYTGCASKGLRVLAMAAKWVPSSVLNGEKKRGELEKGLTFAGFLTLSCPFKPHTRGVLSKLQQAATRIVMITGDAALTACEVSRELGLNSRGKTLVLAPAPPASSSTSSNGVQQDALPQKEKEVGEAAEGGQGQVEEGPLVWTDTKGGVAGTFDGRAESVVQLAKSHELCVSGRGFERLPEEIKSVAVRHANVFARVSPQQKEDILIALNRTGDVTLMCGDGTNDVGALKAAHVGLSIMASLSSSEAGGLNARGGGGPFPGETLEEKLKRQRRQQRMMEGELPALRLGDASIASPFTYKGDSIKCVLLLLRNGRATLVTVFEMYMIMAMNSLITAFSLSVLTLDGVKLGDMQTSVENLYVTVLFFIVSRSPPAKRLAPERPLSSICSPPAVLSLLLQSSVHFACLLYGWSEARKRRPSDWKADLESQFEPDLVNTVVYLLFASMHGAAFLANYAGAPFMVSLWENKPLLHGLGVFLLVLGVFVSEVLPSLNAAFSLVPFPSPEFRQMMCGLILLDIGLSWVIGTATQRLHRFWMQFFAAGRSSQVVAMDLQRKKTKKTSKEL